MVGEISSNNLIIIVTSSCGGLRGNLPEVILRFFDVERTLVTQSPTPGFKTFLFKPGIVPFRLTAAQRFHLRA